MDFQVSFFLCSQLSFSLSQAKEEVRKLIACKWWWAEYHHVPSESSDERLERLEYGIVVE
jgi:hypothetical protein